VSCAPPPTFRLLDGWVGWDPDPALGANAWLGLQGLGEGEALELALVGGGVDPSQLIGYLPPATLACGCACEWYFVSPAPHARVYEVDSCIGCAPICGAAGALGTLIAPVAIAVRDHRIAVADPGAGNVRIWTKAGEIDAGIVWLANARLVALAPWNELLVIADGHDRVLRFTPTGDPLGEMHAPLPTLAPGGAYDRLGAGGDKAVYVVTREPAIALDGTAVIAYKLWRAPRDAAVFAPATIAELAAAFAPTGVVAASDVGFCLARTAADGSTVQSCYAWADCATATVVPAPATREKLGQLLTTVIDSGIPRCRWHRVRVDADVPFGTTLEVAISTSESPNPPAQGVASAPWTAFPAGVPYPSDWQASTANDYLALQPPGRYAFVRVRLTGDGTATPSVRRIRLDMPRATSLDFLPAIYRIDPAASDFTERFLSLFDATIGDIDRAIERSPALLDADGVPDAALPWLASFLDIAVDASWTPAQTRAIIDAAPALYRARGTVAGLSQTIELIAGVIPVIEELPLERLWGALGTSAIVRGTRLFGRGASRAVLAQSRLGATRLKSYGAIAQDPYTQTAFRFRVLVPPAPTLVTGTSVARLEQVLATQKPAHTAATVRVGGGGFIVGVWANVGVDSVFASVPAPVIGASGNVRLSRMSVLWPRRGGTASGVRVGIARVGEGLAMQ
jgi:phage tail-like protein